MIPFLYRGASLALTLMTLNWLLSGIWIQNYRKLFHFVPFVFFLFFFLHLMGVAYSENILEAGTVLEKKLSFLVLPLVLFTSKPMTHQQIRQLIKAFIFGNILSVVIALSYASYLYFTTSLGIKSFFYTHLLSGLVRHPTYVGLNMGIALFVLLFSLMDHKIQISNHEKKWAKILLPIFGIFLLMLVSRMVILSFGFVLVIIATAFFIKQKAWIKGLLFYFLISITALGIYNIPQIKIRVHSVSKDARPNLWRAATHVIQQNLWIGVGTGDVQDALLPIYKSMGQKVAYHKSYNTHNLFLQPLVMLGMLGLIGFGLTFIAPIKLAYPNHPLYIVILVFFLITGMTEALIERQEGVMLYAFITVLGSCHFLKEKNKKLIL